MPTLRNKTTDKGAIIRWKPHPKHARPSTYQLSPRAVSFLSDIGFSAPSPGDEVVIPPQVCRPLRLLGDLYFESESQGDVDLDTSPGEGYYQSSKLSSDQLGELRSYVESHPSYIGGFRTELEEELEDVPRSEEDIPRPVLNPDSQSIRRSSGGEILLPKPFYFGRVDRISNNRNAMLATTSGKDINLGRLPKSSVGNWTVGIEYRGHWTMCLVPHEWSTGYRGSVREYIDKLSQLTGLEGLNRILNIENRHYGESIEDSELDVYICYAGHGLGVAYHGEWTIIVDSELVTAGQRLNVNVEEVYGNIGLAVPQRPHGDSRLSIGDRVKLDIDKIGKNLVVGTHHGQLVTVPRETDVIPREISVGISETDGGYVSGTVDALDPAYRPTTEENLTIQERKIKNYPEIPVDLPEVPLSDSDRIQLPVSTVNTDSISVSAKVYQKRGLFGAKDRITSPSQHWSEDGFVVKMSDIPVVVEGGRYVPGVKAQVRPTGFADGFVKAEFEQFDVPAISTTIEEGLESGDEKLRAQEYTEAVQSFTGVAQMIDQREDPERWISAIEQEIIGLVARAVAKNNTEEASEILRIRKRSLAEERQIHGSVADTVVEELSALSQILEANSCLEDAGEDTEGTKARHTAKKLLNDAVTHLSDLPSLAGQKRPHWLIGELLQQVSDELLLVPSSVEEYLETIDTNGPR